MIGSILYRKRRHKFTLTTADFFVTHCVTNTFFLFILWLEKSLELYVLKMLRKSYTIHDMGLQVVDFIGVFISAITEWE